MSSGCGSIILKKIGKVEKVSRHSLVGILLKNELRWFVLCINIDNNTFKIVKISIIIYYLHWLSVL